MSSALDALRAGEVHVRLVRPEACTSRLEQLAALLSDEEHERGARYVFQRDRDRHVITRALVRLTLSHYVAPAPPEAWEFACNKYGRPQVSAPSVGLGLRFNVSHTDGLIACAIAWEREIGVDVEYVSPRVDVCELAPSVFADAELNALLAMEGERQRERFFTLWTLKEAYIKARGMGLSLPLHRFWYEFETGAPRLTVDTSLGDAGDTWQLLHALATPMHHFALAIRRAKDETPIRIWSGAPLGDWSPGFPVVQ